VFSNPFTPLARLGSELQRWAEEVREQAELIGVQIVHQLHHFGITQAVIAEQLADTRPILLLDMRVVVRVVGARACELDGLLVALEIAQQMPGQEFRAVIAIEPLDLERQCFLNGFDLRHHAICALVPGSPAFRPAGADIGHGQAPHEVPRKTVAAMCHRVGFNKTVLGYIPHTSLNGVYFLSNVPGLVPDSPLRPALARIGLSRRSMVAAEIESSMTGVSADSG